MSLRNEIAISILPNRKMQLLTQSFKTKTESSEINPFFLNKKKDTTKNSLFLNK